MTSREFCYWLQGYFEIGHAPGASGGLNPAQVDQVKKHLALVFVHEIDPSYPANQQAKLDAIHESGGTIEQKIAAALEEHETKKPHSLPDPKGLVMRC